MRRVEIDVGSEARRKVAKTPICSMEFEPHDWIYVEFLNVTVQVCCAVCGRTPLEIMAEWPLLTRSG
jgi:hypothetical protein